jgi:hypothetical protein
MQVNKLLAGAAGAIEICLGVVHFISVNGLVNSGGFAMLSPNSLNLFKLAMLCTGLLLIFAGVISLATLKLYDENRKYFVAICRIQFLLWALRFYLEGQFPVKVPMLFINEPTQLINLVAFILCLLFLIASFYKKKELENKAE